VLDIHWVGAELKDVAAPSEEHDGGVMECSQNYIGDAHYVVECPLRLLDMRFRAEFVPETVSCYGGM
jgi:hypothetical protein